MRGIHFSLRSLFGVVSFLAIGCGVLIYASPFLSKLTFTAAVTALLVGLFSAVYRIGDQRAFWAAFATFGFVYLWMVCGTWQSPDGSTALRDRLVTSDLLIRCHDLLPARQTAVSVATPAMTGSVSYTTDSLVTFSPYQNAAQIFFTQAPVATPTIDRTDFLTTGHSLFAILFALLGAAITRRCSSRAGDPSTDTSPQG